MATPAQLAAKLSTLLVSIKNKINGKLDSGARAADSSKLEGLTLAQVMAKTVTDNLGQVNGRKGEAAFFTQDGTPGAMSGAEMLTSIRFASDDAAITALKNETVTFATVFNTWQRISHDTSGVFPANVAEMNSWSYDAGTDSIQSTVNSNTLIGMISLDRFDAYTFETAFSSTSADDDYIGMCAAFKRANGREYTLSVFVTGLGTILIIVNHNQGVALGQQTLWSQNLGIPPQNWNAAGALLAGARVKITRTAANMLEVTCTKPDGTAWPTPVFTTVAIPAIFQGACQIGYVAHSQANSTWKNFAVPVAKRDIIDTRDLTVWRWNSSLSQWVNAGKANNPAVLPPGRLYKNTEGTKGSYYLDFEGNFITLGVSNQS